MARLSKDRSALLDKLVSDSITFGLKPDEALEYIRREFEPVSRRAYFRRRQKLSSEESHMLWLSYFTRVGFVQLHKQQMDIIHAMQDHSVKRFHNELEKKNPNDFLLLKLSADIRANSVLLTEFSLGTPVIAGLKARLDKHRSRDDPNGANTVDFYYKNHLSNKV